MLSNGRPHPTSITIHSCAGGALPFALGCLLFAQGCLLFAQGCASQPPPKPAPPADDPAELGFARVMEATDLDGTPIAAAGEQPPATVILVFASWCEPCRQELATLDDLRELHPRLRVIGVNAYEEWSSMSDRERLRGFLNTHAPWLTVVEGNDKLLTTFGGVPKIPTLFVYDQRGRLVSEFRRDRRSVPTRDELASAIARAVKQ